MLRSAGYTAQVLPKPDEQTVRLGEQCASGRECHPYAIIAGELAQLARNSELGDGDVFLVPSCTSPCRLRQYGDALRILLRREQMPRIEVWDPATGQIGDLVGTKGLWRLYEGLARHRYSVYSVGPPSGPMPPKTTVLTTCGRW